MSNFLKEILNRKSSKIPKKDLEDLAKIIPHLQSELEIENTKLDLADFDPSFGYSNILNETIINMKKMLAFSYAIPIPKNETEEMKQYYSIFLENKKYVELHAISLLVAMGYANSIVNDFINDVNEIPVKEITKHISPEELEKFATRLGIQSGGAFSIDLIAKIFILIILLQRTTSSYQNNAIQIGPGANQQLIPFGNKDELSKKQGVIVQIAQQFGLIAEELSVKEKIIQFAKEFNKRASDIGDNVRDECINMATGMDKNDIFKNYKTAAQLLKEEDKKRLKEAKNGIVQQAYGYLFEYPDNEIPNAPKMEIMQYRGTMPHDVQAYDDDQEYEKKVVHKQALNNGMELICNYGFRMQLNVEPDNNIIFQGGIYNYDDIINVLNLNYDNISFKIKTLKPKSDKKSIEELESIRQKYSILIDITKKIKYLMTLPLFAGNDMDMDMKKIKNNLDKLSQLVDLMQKTYPQEFIEQQKKEKLAREKLVMQKEELKIQKVNLELMGEMQKGQEVIKKINEINRNLDELEKKEEKKDVEHEVKMQKEDLEIMEKKWKMYFAAMDEYFQIPFTFLSQAVGGITKGITSMSVDIILKTLSGVGGGWIAKGLFLLALLFAGSVFVFGVGSMKLVLVAVKLPFGMLYSVYKIVEYPIKGIVQMVLVKTFVRPTNTPTIENAPTEQAPVAVATALSPQSPVVATQVEPVTPEEEVAAAILESMRDPAASMRNIGGSRRERKTKKNKKSMRKNTNKKRR